MKYVGYHRVSSKEQNLDRGIHEIMEFCKNNNISLYKNKVYTDKQTGKDFYRPKYVIVKEELLEEGDCLIVTELDRLGRNKENTLQELQYYKKNKIRVMILEIPTTLMNLSQMDNHLSKMLLETVNNMLIEMYATFAQAEMEKREKRQREGIKEMKERGDWERYGRPRVMQQQEFNKRYAAVIQGEKRPVELMRELNLKQATFYRYAAACRKGETT